MDGAGTSGAAGPRRARSGAGAWARLPGQVRAPGAAQARGAEPFLRSVGVPGGAVPEVALLAGQRGRRVGYGTLGHRGGLRPDRAVAGVLSRGSPRRQGTASDGSAARPAAAGE